MAKVPSRASMSSLAGSSGSRTSHNRVRIEEPPTTQLTRPRRRKSVTQPSSPPVSHSQGPDDSTAALENHRACLETVKDLECDLQKVGSDLQKVEAERDKLREENQALRQQLSQAQHAQFVGRTWEDIQQAAHGVQEAINTCHHRIISCMANPSNTGVPSATLPGSTAGPDSLWAGQDEGLGMLNPQMFSFDA
ncbi:hypothetical protein NYO67_4598 [Aspergillus flavus]|nr:hypothetical protein NYO67_4598 [Aspergillus flavus]